MVPLFAGLAALVLSVKARSGAWLARLRPLPREPEHQGGARAEPGLARQPRPGERPHGGDRRRGEPLFAGLAALVLSVKARSGAWLARLRPLPGLALVITSR
jgi:hypothetical protein